METGQGWRRSEVERAGGCECRLHGATGAREPLSPRLQKVGGGEHGHTHPAPHRLHPPSGIYAHFARWHAERTPLAAAPADTPPYTERPRAQAGTEHQQPPPRPSWKVSARGSAEHLTAVATFKPAGPIPPHQDVSSPNGANRPTYITVITHHVGGKTRAMALSTLAVQLADCAQDTRQGARKSSHARGISERRSEAIDFHSRILPRDPSRYRGIVMHIEARARQSKRPLGAVGDFIPGRRDSDSSQRVSFPGGEVFVGSARTVCRSREK
ncbi:hypothetical protein FB451DRAFT_1239644 [Mycena latifolia]|nr:hypothetical protein FB451DRAFT_1239644 [Mycena latifolia]